LLLIANRRVVAWRQLLAEVAPPVAAGAVVGLLLFRVPARLALQLAFALSVVGLSALELHRLAASARADAPVPAARRGLPFLFAGGVAHGLFSTGGPMIVYVLRRRLVAKGVFRATLAALWLSLNGALLVNYATMDLYSRETGLVSLVLAAAVLPGILVGQRLHRALAPDTFHRLDLLMLLASGTALALRTALSLL
jgi:hypothetical protein